MHFFQTEFIGLSKGLVFVHAVMVYAVGDLLYTCRCELT